MNDLIRFAIEQQAAYGTEGDWEDFQEKMKLSPSTSLKLGMRINTIRNSSFLQQTLSRSYKSYPNTPQLPLPMARLVANRNMEDIIRTRRSLRQYSVATCKAQEVANVLQMSYGITGETAYSEQEFKQYLRSVPSAGALYPLEIYIWVLKVEGIGIGLYHYRVAKNSLELLRAGDVLEDFKKLGDWTGVDIENAAFITAITALFERATYKYGNRGYRFSLLEVGFVSMMMDLVANAMGIGVCHLGGFYDDLVNRYLNINGVTESVQTILAFGKSS